MSTDKKDPRIADGQLDSGRVHVAERHPVAVHRHSPVECARDGGCQCPCHKCRRARIEQGSR